jgi:hypothetical protein
MWQGCFVLQEPLDRLLKTVSGHRARIASDCRPRQGALTVFEPGAIAFLMRIRRSGPKPWQEVVTLAKSHFNRMFGHLALLRG